MNKLYLLLLLLTTLFTANAQENFVPIDSIINTYNGKTAPGFSVRVLKDGKAVYSNTAGYANLEQQTKITDKSVFYLASTSKQFTAACIVLLQQQGKLSLKDNLRKYMPEFPAYAKKITLLHLLTHTSGLKDYPILAELKGEDSDEYTNAQIKEMMVMQQPDFAPGEKMNYCNTGYWCLAQIVEKVSGQHIAEFAEKNIFAPLGMKNTAYITKQKNDIDNKAVGYALENGIYKATNIDAKAIGGGGVYSTLDDLEKWVAEMQTHSEFGDTFWKAMTEDDAYESDNTKYTKGLFISKYGGKTMIQHGGDVSGYHPILAYFPEDKVGVIILSNDDSFVRFNILRASVNRLLGFKYRYPAKTENVLAKTQNFAPYLGSYKLDEGQYIMIQENNGALNFIQLWNGINVSLDPTADENTFALEKDQGLFVFKNFKDNKAQNISFKQGEDTSEFLRMDKMPENNDYKIYEGTYHSPALNKNIEIYTSEGLVYLKLENGKTDWGIESEKETFSTRYGDLYFKKDKTGKVTGFALNHDRAKNLEFIKQKSE